MDLCLCIIAVANFKKKVVIKLIYIINQLNKLSNKLKIYVFNYIEWLMTCVMCHFGNILHVYWKKFLLTFSHVHNLISVNLIWFNHLDEH